MKRIRPYLVLATMLVAPAVSAADAETGKRVAFSRCATCHIVEPGQRNEVADSPPFDVIAMKAGFDPMALAYLILNPHPKMNVTLTFREAQDVAAYMSSLMK